LWIKISSGRFWSSHYFKTKIFEPYQLASFLSKNKTKRWIPDYSQSEKQSLIKRYSGFRRYFYSGCSCFWVKPSVAFLEKYIVENNIDTIVTSGPPHSLHLIGLELKQKLDLKWFADFRDPWTTIGYHKSLRSLCG
jgi:hypothetical protein